MNYRLKAVKDIVLTAMLTATLSGGKLALILIFNVEVVTLFIIVYACVFGLKISLTSTLIFVTLECFLHGFGTWVLLYFIHWPTLCVFSFLLTKLLPSYSKKGARYYAARLVAYTSLAIILTAAFGVTSSLIDALIGAGRTSFAFTYLFPIIYLRGVPFYITHVVSNTVIVAVCFLPLSSFLYKLKAKYYGQLG
ncbi:MAG: hypothetical protein EOM87_05090 [Clostridia bacterium]|nr:hypothetical protein [Clostridia bacterium]